MTEERARHHRGGRRARSARPEDAMPAPAALDEEIRELVVRTLSFRQRYAREYELGLATGGGTGVHVSGGHVSKPVEEAWSSPANRAQRAACRSAAKRIRSALDAVKAAEAALSGEVDQHAELDDRAVMSQGDFDRALHMKRERELRKDW
jgi:hypothetical protein